MKGFIGVAGKFKDLELAIMTFCIMGEEVVMFPCILSFALEVRGLQILPLKPGRVIVVYFCRQYVLVCWSGKSRMLTSVVGLLIMQAAQC